MVLHPTFMLNDLDEEQRSKLGLVEFKLAQFPHLLNKSELPGSYISHSPYWVMSSIPVLRTGHWHDITEQVLKCGLPVEGVRRWCLKDKLCSCCAGFASGRLYNSATSNAPYQPEHYFYYHITWTPSANYDYELTTTDEFHALWDTARRYVEGLRTSGLIAGYCYGEELYISNILSKQVYPHSHFVVAALEPLHVESGTTYIRTAISPELGAATGNLSIVPIDSAAQYKNALRYLIKPLDFNRQYKAEIAAGALPAELNSSLEGLIGKYLAVVSGRRKHGRIGIYRTRKGPTAKQLTAQLTAAPRRRGRPVGAKDKSPRKKQLKSAVQPATINTEQVNNSESIFLSTTAGLMAKRAQQQIQAIAAPSSVPMPVPQDPKSRRNRWRNVGLGLAGGLGAAYLGDKYLNDGKALNSIQRYFSPPTSTERYAPRSPEYIANKYRLTAPQNWNEPFEQTKQLEASRPQLPSPLTTTANTLGLASLVGGAGRGAAWAGSKIPGVPAVASKVTSLLPTAVKATKAVSPVWGAVSRVGNPLFAGVSGYDLGTNPDVGFAPETQAGQNRQGLATGTALAALNVAGKLNPITGLASAFGPPLVDMRVNQIRNVLDNNESGLSMLDSHSRLLAGLREGVLRNKAEPREYYREALKAVRPALVLGEGGEKARYEYANRLRNQSGIHHFLREAERLSGKKIPSLDELLGSPEQSTLLNTTSNFQKFKDNLMGGKGNVIDSERSKGLPGSAISW